MRKPRQHSKTSLYHVVIRGVNKQNIFFDDKDKELFLSLVKKYSIKYDIKIYAYCLMDNHVHLEIGDPKKQISIFMQCLCSVYARIFNVKYDRIGHLFQERFASEVIDDDSQFLSVFRYILQNPMKAGICALDKYNWSSYKFYNNQKSFIDKELILGFFSSISKLKNFLSTESDEQHIEIELRRSEREKNYIEKIKNILETDNPIIQPDLPIETIKNKIRKLKNSGFSIQTIVRTTGISKYYVQLA